MLLLVALACSPLQYNLRTIKIGLVAPITGPRHAEGEAWVPEVRAMVSEWNRGATGLYRVELVIYDESEGPVVARRLAVDPEVLGVAGYADPANLERDRPVYDEARIRVAAGLEGVRDLLAGVAEATPGGPARRPGSPTYTR